MNDFDTTPLLPYVNSFIGGPRSALPTPSICVSLATLKRNVARFYEAADKLNVKTRIHVKTHKTTEGTGLSLDGGGKAAICSTIREIRGLESLVKEGVVNDILYGLPPARSYIPILSNLTTMCTIRLFLDNIAHVAMLNAAPPLSGGKWSVFIKVDCGTQRAGLPLDSPELSALIKAASDSPNIDVYGYYCHAGHSYGSRSAEDALAFLRDELNQALSAGELHEKVTGSKKELVLSIGATPTAHALGDLHPPTLPDNITLEIHAGNFPFNDLQQLATGTIRPEDLAVTVNAEIVSVYEHRNEALINAGCLALARETGQIEGFGTTREKEGWCVGRVSQEHGILTNLNKSGRKVTEDWKVGDRVVLDIQHACIALAGFDWIFILDGDDSVRDVWFPWRGWL